MSSLLSNVTNSVWHAFMALQPADQAAVAMVSKSKLKVLTANIASLFDLYGVERGLEHYHSTSTLHFEHFRHYLLQEVFAGLPAARLQSLANLRSYEVRIEEICWLICRCRYATTPTAETQPAPPLADALRFKLFRIFCMLADLVTRNGRSSQCDVLLHPTEAAHILQALLHGMGHMDCDTNGAYAALCADDCAPLTFGQFLQLFATAADSAERSESLAEAIDELYQTYINDVIKKGYLWRRGYLLPTLKEYWFVLQPGELTFYKNAAQRDVCGTIVLDANSCMVRPHTVATTASASVLSLNAVSNGGGSGGANSDRHMRFSLTAHERHFELAAVDHRTRLQWIAALQLAITYSTGRGANAGYQRDQCARRRKRRELEQRRRDELERQRSRHAAEARTTRTQLEQEREARAAAERQAHALQLVVHADLRRVAELEGAKVQLERLLLEEQQAKRDEEIVRALQARVLAEEWEKRAELEQLQEEQRAVLEGEREKQRAFEAVQRVREERLCAAEERLRQLEGEREALDAELQQARCKIVQSEQNKMALEQRLLLVQVQEGAGEAHRDSCAGRRGGGGERLRRALSFMHTNRERTFGCDLGPVCLVARARSKSPLPQQNKPILASSVAQ